MKKKKTNYLGKQIVFGQSQAIKLLSFFLSCIKISQYKEILNLVLEFGL